MTSLRRLATALLPTAGFVLLLLAVEGAVRHALPPREPLEVLVASATQQGDFRDDNDVRIFEGDPLLFWRLQRGLDRVPWDFTIVSTNGHGLRHPRPVGDKAPGSLRVVALGDSVTFGYRVPLVFPQRPNEWDARQQPYPRLLESALRRSNAGRTVEVVTLAVPGFSSHQGIAWARRALDKLRPDLVTWCYGWNDVSMRPLSDADGMPATPLLVAARAAGMRSQALLHAATALRRWRGIGSFHGPLVPRVDTDTYVAHAREFARRAREAGAVPLVIGPVYRDPVTFPAEAHRIGWHRAALRDAMAADGTPYVEIPRLMESAHPDNEGLFGELIHPNAEGHRLVADAVLEHIAHGSMLPGWTVPERLTDADPIEPWPLPR